MPKKSKREADLYPVVQRWMKRRFGTFRERIGIGLKYSRADVIGVRDIGGDLSGETETIIIEVKRNTEPFATASGQAYGYTVYANRVYLADERPNGFDRNEMQIASRLGVGLIHIKKDKCTEILSSPSHQPIGRMSLEILERMALGRCRICETIFETGSGGGKRHSNLARWNYDRSNHLHKALRDEKGLIFWNYSLSARKRKMGLRKKSDDRAYDRRFICAECLDVLWGPLFPDE